MIEVGMRGRAEALVTQEQTALHMGSGSLPVFATPCMTALMERAAVAALAPAICEGESTVGTRLEVSHDAATPVDMEVWAEAVVTGVEGRRISFAVAAYDGAGPIGGGKHDRVLITIDRFLTRAEGRKEVGSHVH